MLNFNTDKYEFGKIYDAIKHFYPITTKKKKLARYFPYPGLKKLDKIVADNLYHPDHYSERWVEFTDEIEKEIGKEIFETTDGSTASFSSLVLLDSTSLHNLTRRKELHFYVSLLGPFYTILGQDKSTVKLDEDDYEHTMYLVVSPENEFADTFKFLCDRIESRFKGYRFVPFRICQQIIEGIQIPFAPDPSLSIFNALFDVQMDTTDLRVTGDDYFKSDEWIKEGYTEPEGVDGLPADAMTSLYR